VAELDGGVLVPGEVLDGKYEIIASSPPAPWA